MSGLQEMFDQYQATSSPTLQVEAIQKTVRNSPLLVVEASRYDQEDMEDQSPLKEMGVRMSSSAHNLKEMMGNRQSMEFDDQLETIRVEGEEKEPVPYKTIGKTI